MIIQSLTQRMICLGSLLDWSYQPSILLLSNQIKPKKIRSLFSCPQVILISIYCIIYFFSYNVIPYITPFYYYYYSIILFFYSYISLYYFYPIRYLSIMENITLVSYDVIVLCFILYNLIWYLFSYSCSVILTFFFKIIFLYI